MTNIRTTNKNTTERFSMNTVESVCAPKYKIRKLQFVGANLRATAQHYGLPRIYRRCGNFVANGLSFICVGEKADNGRKAWLSFNPRTRSYYQLIRPGDTFVDAVE